MCARRISVARVLVASQPPLLVPLVRAVHPYCAAGGAALTRNQQRCQR
jgi:hypothetical protein